MIIFLVPTVAMYAICGKDFEIKDLGEYHNFYLKSNALLLGDIFDNVRKLCLELYQLDSVRFLSAPGSAWKAALKRAKVELELLMNIDVINGLKRDC